MTSEFDRNLVTPFTLLILHSQPPTTQLTFTEVDSWPALDRITYRIKYNIGTMDY